MKSSRTVALLCLLLISPLAFVQEPAATEAPDQVTQNQYAMQVYSLVNVANEIHAGRAQRLASGIDGRLPELLHQMAGFKATPLKKAVFQAASRLMRSSGGGIPSDLQSSFDIALGAAGAGESPGCYQTLPKCAAKDPKCIPLPMSLPPIDTTAPDPNGWHYAIGTTCGVRGWHSWKFWQGCGEPLASSMCYGDEGAGGAVEPHAHARAAQPHPAAGDVPDVPTQEQYATQVLDLINVSSEIHHQREQQLFGRIMPTLPDHLRRMIPFHNTPAKLMAFRMARDLFRATDTPLPADVNSAMDQALAGGINEMQSEGCFKVMATCTSAKCLGMPWSLLPVDKTTPDPMGFHYLINSNCGVKGWKGLKFWDACGPEITASACTGEIQPSPETGVMPNVPEGQALPEGVVYATAAVTQDSTIDVQQPGYAVVATANVTEVKRVNPGEHLNVRQVASIAFDDGTGLLIHLLTRRADDHFNATVGKDSVISEDHPLPVNNGNATVYVGSDKPFNDCAVAVNDQNKTPAVTQAVIRDARGEKVGQLSTFRGLPVQASSVSVRTLDSSGRVVEQAPVSGGVLNGMPSVQFDKPSYKQGDRGVLLIGNQDGYKQAIEMTRFGGAKGIEQEPIRLLQVSDVKGLPPEVPFNTRTLSFVTTHAGQARVALAFPRMTPPRFTANPGNDPELQRANSVFELWRNSFVK